MKTKVLEFFIQHHISNSIISTTYSKSTIRYLQRLHLLIGPLIYSWACNKPSESLQKILLRSPYLFVSDIYHNKGFYMREIYVSSCLSRYIENTGFS